MSLLDIRTGGRLGFDAVPDGLRPELATDTLPNPTEADLRQLAAQGWMRFGIVVALIDDRRRIMMLEHRPSAKAPTGALGPMAETAQLSRLRDEVTVETTVQTLARAIREELGRDPTGTPLRARKVGSWELTKWPVGYSYGDQQAFGISPIVHVTREQRDRIQDEFTGTEEISGVQFMSLDQIGERNVRPGTHIWLGLVANSPLMDVSPEESLELFLPSGTAMPGAVDARLQEVIL